MEGERPTQERRGDETRRKIFGAAEEEFEQRGYHHAAIEDIAKRAGVATGTFYQYFPSKLAAFTFVASVRVAQWIDETLGAPDGGPEEDRVPFDVLTGYFAWITSRPAVVRLCREAETADPALVPLVYGAPVHRWTEKLNSWMDAGIIRRREPEPLAWLIIAFAEFATLASVLWQPEGKGAEELRLAFVEAVTRTLVATD